MSREVEALRELAKALETYENARAWVDNYRGEVAGLRVEWSTGMYDKGYAPLRALIEQSVSEQFRIHAGQALSKLLGQVETARQAVAAATIDEVLGGGGDEPVRPT